MSNISPFYIIFHKFYKLYNKKCRGEKYEKNKKGQKLSNFKMGIY